LAIWAAGGRLPEKTRSPLAGLCRIIGLMHWIAPSKKDAANRASEQELRRQLAP
jgi:hypothetical protein